MLQQKYRFLSVPAEETKVLQPQMLQRTDTVIIEQPTASMLARQKTLVYDECTSDVESEVSLIDCDTDDEEIIMMAKRPEEIAAWQAKKDLEKWVQMAKDQAADDSEISDLELPEQMVKSKKRKEPTPVVPVESEKDEDDIHFLFKDYDWAEGVENEIKSAEGKAIKKGKKSQGPKVMRWCVTWNNPTVDGNKLGEKLQACDNIKGYVFQKEQGESGTPHFQMYIEFKIAVYTTGVKEALGHTGHCIAAKGTKKQNIAYCTKDDDRLDGPWVWGTCTTPDKSGKQGKRTDLDEFAEAVSAKGCVDEEIAEEFRGMVMRFGKHAQQMVDTAKYRKAKADELAYWQEQVAKKNRGEATDGQKQRKLYLYFGPTAVGKTTNVKLDVVEAFGEMPFEKDGNNKWWDGYVDEKAILVDEWRLGFGSIETFNAITNVGVTRVEHKGGYGTLTADAMYFTTNSHPLDIFDTKWVDGRYRAMARRFHKVYWWNDDKELTVLENPHFMMGDEREDAEAAWIRFWKRDKQQNVVRVEDENRRRDDPAFSLAHANDDKYFTW